MLRSSSPKRLVARWLACGLAALLLAAPLAAVNAAEPPFPPAGATSAPDTTVPEAPEAPARAAAGASLPPGAAPDIRTGAASSAGWEMRQEWGRDPQSGFVKGDLARVGTTQLLTNRDRLGLRAGMQRIAHSWYTQLTPELDLQYLGGDLQVGFSAPFRFLVLDEEAPVDEAYHGLTTDLRDEDWDEAGDFLKVLHYFTYGRKEEELFVSVGQSFAGTIGHGTLVRRYAPNVDVDHTRTSFEADFYNDYVGVEAFAADLLSPRLVGALAFVKPGAFLGDDRPLKRLSIGVSFAADPSAPRRLSGASDGETYPLDSAGNPVFEEEALVGYGVDAEIKIVRTEHADLKPYVDYSRLDGHGGGLSAGMLGRFTWGSEGARSALRLRVEGRSFDADYLPGYFDCLYEFQRYQFVRADSPTQGVVPTKLQWLEDQTGGDRRWGYRVEASYAVVGWFALSAALEDSTASSSRALMLHGEIPASRYLTFFLTYHRRWSEDLAVPFDFEEDTELFFWAWRLQLLPFLAINYRAQRAFEVDRDARRGVERLYANVFHFVADIELSYTF